MTTRPRRSPAPGRPIPKDCCTWCGHLPHDPKRCGYRDCPCANHNERNQP